MPTITTPRPTTRRATSRPTTGRTSSRSISPRKSDGPGPTRKRVRMTSTRMESDSFGPIAVPEDCYWGAQTERSIANFPFGPREAMPVEIVHALGFIKQAAARVNARNGGLDAELAEAVQPAASEGARGDLDRQLPLVIWQTGSGP